MDHVVRVVPGVPHRLDAIRLRLLPYLPDDPSVSRRAGWLTGLGNFVTLSWLGIAGAVVARRRHLCRSDRGSS